jgi:hypothetical protein
LGASHLASKAHIAPPKVRTGNASGNRKDNLRYKSVSVSAVNFVRGVGHSQEGGTVEIAEKRRIMTSRPRRRVESFCNKRR